MNESALKETARAIAEGVLLGFYVTEATRKEVKEYVDSVAPRVERILAERLQPLLAAGKEAQDGIFTMIRWAEEGQTPNESARTMKAETARALRAQLAQWKGE